ncbi:MAG: hypothetical protein IT582_01435, partial [Opitutaceae bacterium]|nr:hypothetical protein [Opitutaceae bacterium]
MPETDFSFSHVETPAAGATVPAGPIVIRGWVWPKPGGHFVDVRARLGESLFPGVHGFPRADLAAHFGSPKPHLLAEFEISARLAPGPAPITLEVLTIEGDWRAFHELRLNAVGAADPTPVCANERPLRWHEYGRALQMLLRAQHREPATPLAALAARLAAALPRPRDLRHPHLPFHGHLDEPAAVTRCGFGRTAVLGWLFHETRLIKRVLATFDLLAWQTVDHPLASPGPAAHFPAYPNAARAGLFGIIDVPAQLPSPVTLRLYAELDDGSLHLCGVQRSLLCTNEDEKAPYPARGHADFDSTCAALDAALVDAGFSVVRDSEMETELVRVRDDFTLRAPAALPSPTQLRPTPMPAATAPKRVLLATHNLNHEGAPLFLLDYARFLAQSGTALTILSPSDGPLRDGFAALGARVWLIDVDAVFQAKSEAAARAVIAAAFQSFDWAAHDLVVCNTFTTFWAVHAAKAAARPVLLYVHESTTPASFYLGRVHPAVVALVDAAFGLADTVSFTTASTRNYHL